MADGFVATGNMPFARSRGTATLLPSGKVLIAGGADINGAPLDSAALYDPATGVFTPSQSHMLTPRADHVAVLLQNGKVLIAGDGNIFAAAIGIPPTKAEIYDPATDQFTATGSMLEERRAPGATLLPDGTVLFVGGSGCCLYSEIFVMPNGLGSTEIYDPTTGVFSPGGHLAAPREHPAIAPLADGTVLVTGGSWNYISQIGSTLILDTHVNDSAETYLYPSGGFHLTNGPMGGARTGHVAVRLQDDSVLVAYAAYDPSNYYLTTLPTNVEDFDAITGLFASATSPPAIDRTLFNQSVLLNNGSVLMAGGVQTNATGTPNVASADLYVPGLHAFVPTNAPMTVARASHTLTKLADGRVLVTGGLDAANNPLASAEIYDPNMITDEIFKNGFDPALLAAANTERQAPRSTCADLQAPIWKPDLGMSHEWYDRASGRICRSSGL
ncbi:kelch repeat-containing protein [Dokdonella soli]|uniref:Kelch repeat-containing protein n=2 Tax=Dokdonella soli TaxID=529810 RepID=A0ABP3TWF4_9GAMM